MEMAICASTFGVRARDTSTTEAESKPSNPRNVVLLKQLFFTIGGHKHLD
jgi:hypothetical protein